MRVSAVAVLFALLLYSAPVPAQLRVQPIAEHQDVTALRLMLRKLASSGTFMQTTAHPDDEDNGLLAMLGHGDGMRTVLVSATRGDGGQNEIGPELFQALGVLRTEELLAVHRFDGAEQYFTRAVDFGYSFSVEESLQKWGRDEIVGDYVRHIRATRPDVIAGFLCGGDGGGQHHQASALLTREAFRAAADPSKYPEQIAEGLRPWQAARVFCTDAAFGPRAAAAPDPAVLEVPVNRFEPLLGRTYHEIGIEARSMHKCQGTSQLLPLPGAAGARRYRLQDAVLGQTGIAPKALFDGIDTSLAGLSRFAGSAPPASLISALRAIAEQVDVAARSAGGDRPDAAVPPLATGLGLARQLRGQLGTLGLTDIGRYEIDFRLEQKERQFQKALVLAQGLRIEVLANDGVVTVGQPVKLSVIGGNNGSTPVIVKSVAREGFDGRAAECRGTVAPAGVLKCEADLRIGRVPLSTPYWKPRTDAARYDFDQDVPFGVPFRPSPFKVTMQLAIGGADVMVEQVVEYRYDEVTAGEKRMELKVVPPFAVSLRPQIAVIPQAAVSAGGSRRIEVTVANSERGAATATVMLEAPSGWRVTPASAPVSLAREDESATLEFSVAPPRDAKVGAYTISAVVEGTVNGSAKQSTLGYDVVEYPHIHRRHVVEPASTRLEILDVTVPTDLAIGYVVGVGDQVPQAIEQLGARVVLLGPDDLASGDLSHYDVIMTGVRAYERRPDLRANNRRLIQYAENGGTVLVQYNKFEFNQAQYGPFPAKVSSNRVTDENAPIEVLVPEDPLFNTPNRLGPDTWAGWVQERGLYFLGDKDPRYVDLVRAADPFALNPGPQTGALVEAKVGKGRWIYIGLGLWRQLPAGTPGAYRLLANLLSLGAAR